MVETRTVDAKLVTFTPICYKSFVDYATSKQVLRYGRSRLHGAASGMCHRNQRREVWAKSTRGVTKTSSMEKDLLIATKRVMR